MNKKISLGVAIGLICVAIAISSAITMSVISSEYNGILKDLPEKLGRYELLEELDNIINNNYYGGNENKNFEAAIADGYVSGLGDNYSQFLTADEYARYLARSKGDMSGIGIEYKKNKNSYIEITGVYDDSPAQSSGLREGDVIIAFDGIMIDVNNYDEMAAKLEGDKLTSVNITYRRDKSDTTVNIVKGYEAKSVSAQTYGSTGYLKISNFYSSTASQVQSEVDKFVSSGMDSIVIDVRKNQSENFDNAMEVLDIFVPMNDASTPAATLVDSKSNVIKKYTTTSGEVGLPMAVLVNEETEAAAELFAVGMRDFGKAELVGKTTGGVGLKREAFVLSDGNAVLLSVGEVMPYRSGSFLSIGIEPDLESDAKGDGKKLATDSQFIAAMSLVSPDAV
ncbi:MAG: S41 family peptidase [Faecalibacterium sp.]|nr:S41 family peptidase [Ruminococcus sp.]MCM1391954.1 S41 family peptidase [Ruminococcus sp.]MCM1484982.1 S41 family peptidase [Faecalibacterium sp.]